MTAVQCSLRLRPFCWALWPRALRPLCCCRKNRPVPRLVEYLGGTLPYAAMGLLVVYCLKDVAWLSGTHGAPELISIALTAGLHVWRRNTLVSIAAGTVCYMLLVQFVFV